jgi:putative serine protease PepD
MVGAASQEDGRTQVAQIYDEASPSVALIQAEVTQETLSPFGPQGGSGTASGSGFVYDDKGHIVTNAHVVEGADAITVSFGDREALDAEVTGILVGSDLAVLKVDPSQVPAEALPLADSSSLDVGDPVVAIGNPFGLERTVTTGIISALQREIQAPDGTTIRDVIQTDAAINPGNSGGPLLDEEGSVIGVNTQIVSQSGGNEGIGLAVPSNTVEKIVDQIIATGKAELPFLGVGGQDLTPEVAAGVGLPTDLRGLLVEQVTTGSGAAKVGLREGDVITSVDGEPVTDQNELSSAIIAHDVGETVKITIVRDGDRQTVEATLGPRPGG